jgi:hypothetical protein
MPYTGQKRTNYTGGYNLSRLFFAFSAGFCALMAGKRTAADWPAYFITKPFAQENIPESVDFFL